MTFQPNKNFRVLDLIRKLNYFMISRIVALIQASQNYVLLKGKIVHDLLVVCSGSYQKYIMELFLQKLRTGSSR